MDGIMNTHRFTRQWLRKQIGFVIEIASHTMFKQYSISGPVLAAFSSDTFPTSKYGSSFIVSQKILYFLHLFILCYILRVRYGRKPSIIGSSLIACIAGIATAFANDFWSFAVLRFLVGTSIIPLSEDPYVLSKQKTGAKQNGYCIFSIT
jgi:MFS family permease